MTDVGQMDGNHGYCAAPSAPVTVTVQVNGSGFASDIFRDLVASFNILQGGNVTVISKKCLLEPSEPNYNTCVTLGEKVTSVQTTGISWNTIQHQNPKLWVTSGHEQERLYFWLTVKRNGWWSRTEDKHRFHVFYFEKDVHHFKSKVKDLGVTLDSEV